MDTYQYSQHKNWILEGVYKFFANNHKQRFGSTLRDYINYACFDSLQDAGETIDELYAACYYMWFYLYNYHNLPINSNQLSTIEKLIGYMENEIKLLSGLQKECLEDDINELKHIKKAIMDEIQREGLDFIAEMSKMDNRLRLRGSPTYQRYGKVNHSANWSVAKAILLDSSSMWEKFLCLSTYCKICMYGEIELDYEVKECLKNFLNALNVDELVAHFTTADEIDIKNFVTFLRRCLDLKPLMSKDEFLNILEEKGIPYNAGNYVDRIEIGDIHISKNTTVSNNIIIPYWDVKIKDRENYYTIARFDNRPDAYIYFLNKYS